jgi:hypothetical protein
MSDYCGVKRVWQLAAVLFSVVVVGSTYLLSTTDQDEVARAAAHAAEAAREGTGIPALSETQATSYLEGNAMWQASVAELNHYPSPSRVLELAEPLGLTVIQRWSTTNLHEEARREAIRLGEELVALEHKLNRIFVWNQASPDNIEKIVLDIGTLRTQIRLTHLVASIRQKALLTEEQVRHYDELRGRGLDSGKTSSRTGCNAAHHHGR